MRAAVSQITGGPDTLDLFGTDAAADAVGRDDTPIETGGAYDARAASRWQEARAGGRFLAEASARPPVAWRLVRYRPGPIVRGVRAGCRG
jgi:hypothetical protein